MESPSISSEAEQPVLSQHDDLRFSCRSKDYRRRRERSFASTTSKAALSTWVAPLPALKIEPKRQGDQEKDDSAPSSTSTSSCDEDDFIDASCNIPDDVAPSGESIFSSVRAGV